MTVYFNLSDDDKKISIKKLELLAAHYLQISKALKNKDVQEVLKKWSGKVYTKRLETALKKIDEHFNVDTRFGYYLEYNFYGQFERSFKHEFINYKGEPDYQWIYINGSHSLRMLTKSSILEDRNIICDDIDKQLLSVADYYERKYNNITEQLKTIDETIEKYKSIIESLNNFTNDIDSDIKAEFKFNVINAR